MSENEPETGIQDEDLPEDLQPDENPLAQPLDEDAEETKSPDELDMHGGKTADESDESDDSGD
jgi:hypothetical protein